MSTIYALVSLIQQKNQWTDYMKNIIIFISINAQTNLRISTTFNQPISNPFRVCDTFLPSCRSSFVSFFNVMSRFNVFIYQSIKMCTTKDKSTQLWIWFHFHNYLKSETLRNLCLHLWLQW